MNAASSSDRAGGRTAVELSGVRRCYALDGGRSLVALDGVDLALAPGSVVAITGPSGSSKSTLLHVIGALEVPDEGRVVVDGRELGGLTVARSFRGSYYILAGRKWRHDFAERLRTAQCAVDTSGSDWLATGTFAVAKLTSGMESAPVLDRAVTTEGPGSIMRGIADQQW